MCPLPSLSRSCCPLTCAEKKRSLSGCKQTRWVIVCSFVENNVLREIIREIYFQNLFFKGQSLIFIKKNFVENYIFIIFYKMHVTIEKAIEKFIFMPDTGILSRVKGMKRQRKTARSIRIQNHVYSRGPSACKVCFPLLRRASFRGHTLSSTHS